LKKIPQILNNLTYLVNYSIMQDSTNKQHLSVICISFATVLLLSFGFTDFDAFAAFTPTQPNAYVSYDNSTNQVQVEWNFTTGDADAPVTCLLKGDFWFYTDLNNKYGSNGVSGVDYDKVKGFTPIHYSVVSSSPTIVGPEKVTEVIPCTGSTRIDLDTVMSHESNVDLNGNPHLDLQIFLSFYALDADTSITLETFAHQSVTYMDQIFVAYTPDDIWNTGFKNYACGGEPGNVLHIDASGSDVDGEPSLIAHGNNGDNCDGGDFKYLYLENNQYVDIGGANNAASLTNGEILNGVHIAESFPSMYLVFASSNNDDCDADCGAPTFGVDRNNNLIVSNGFKYNTQSVHVTNFYTPFDLITVNTNSTNTVTVKVYDNYGPSNIEFVQFGLGMPSVGSPLDDAESLVEISFEDDKIKEVTLEEDHSLIDIITIGYSEVDCAPGSSYECLEVEMKYIYRDQPRYNVMAINAIDFTGNTQTNYLNDGVLVTGESLNEPLLQTVAAGRDDPLYPQKTGNILLTQVDFKTDMWQDEYGYMWSGNGYRPTLVNDVPLPIQEPDNYSKWSGYNDRWHSEFDSYLELQKEKAISTMIEVYPNFKQTPEN